MGFWGAFIDFDGGAKAPPYIFYSHIVGWGQVLNYNNSDNSRPDISGHTSGHPSGIAESGLPSTSRITALALLLPAVLIFCCLAGGSSSFGSDPGRASGHALHSSAHQAASPKQGQGSLASPEKAKNAGTAPAVAISYPPGKKLITPYRQVFLEGKIRASSGIRRVELNGQELFNGAELEVLIQKNWPKLNRGNQGLASQNQDPSRGKGMSKMRQTLKSSLEKYNLYYLNQICPLKEGDNRLNLVVEDNLGHRATKSLDIRYTPLARDRQAKDSHQGQAEGSYQSHVKDSHQSHVEDSHQSHVKGSHQGHVEGSGHTDTRGLDVRAIPPKERSGNLGNPEDQHSYQGHVEESSGSLGSPEDQHRMILALIPPARKASASSAALNAGTGNASTGNASTGASLNAGTGNTGTGNAGTGAASNASTGNAGTGGDDLGDDLSDYIYHRLSESFTRQGRFQLVERAKLPWLLIEKAIQTKDISQQEFARQIGHLTPAEGVIFVEVQKLDNGLEIAGRLVDLKSAALISHRVFAPVREPQGHQAFEELDTIISGLAIKFRDSFPLLTGVVLAREGPNIQINLGSEKAIFRGIWYNILRDDGQELICRAVVEEVAERTSRARVIEKEKIREIRQGCLVSTR
jgi:hypothetical protein